jgi:poly-gamma-glutamate synthase PgsB/CapB
MFIIFISLFILVLIYLFIEYVTLNKAINKIPLRILVNGTRGKTTTVKILYNILRKSDINVFAKTTGDVPTEYYPDGQSKIIQRFSPASIIENVRLLRKWAKFKPEAIILECMALHPENQFILSKKMFKPTHVLVTNVFFDHLEVMGEDIPSISQTMIESFYNKSQILIPESLPSKLKNQFDIQTYPDIYLETTYENIPDIILNENWSLISKACEVLELDRDISAIEFHKVWHQKNENIRINNHKLQFQFWNLFSVNDYESTQRFVEFIQSTHPIEIIFNTRIDRPLRTKYFASLISEYFKENKINITGNGKSLAFKLLSKSGCKNIIKTNYSELMFKFNGGFKQFTIVLGLGNFKGMDEFVSKIKLTNNGEIQ